MDDEEQAFDITSQVFVKALKNLPTYEYRGVPLASWLYRIAKSEVYQAFRNRKAIRTVNVDSVQLIDMMHDMEEEEQEERREKLYLCLKKMNESDMQLIEMRYFEKRSFKEVGEILEITENNAKVKCFRALEKLKRFYTE